MNRKYHSRTSNVVAAVWLIGFGLLWLTGLWWPGILILVGISMLVQVLVRSGIDEEPEIISTTLTDEQTPSPDTTKKTETEKEDAWLDEEAETPAFIQKEKLPGNTALLPEKCFACGGPVAGNAHNVVWMGERTVRCPFCDTVIHI